MTKKVAILGGGIAGLSAAHELIERGFAVDVYERRRIFGGKARSMGVAGSATGGRHALPGEHGFRFFPSFYRHLKDTMKRIPYGSNPNGVFDNLVATTQVLIARAEAAELTLPAELPDDLAGWSALLGTWFGNDLGIPPDEMNFFVDRMLTIMTSCKQPVEVMIALMTDPIREGAPSLAHLERLETNWMNGIQFFLDRDVRMTHGHAIFINSEWALTSVAQGQFWSDVDLSRYGDGNVDGILSVCISDWDTEGILHAKPARACTPEEIKEEVWAQLEARVNDDARPELDAANILAWHLDPAIEYPDPAAPDAASNAEPLLINTVGSLGHRPEANTDIANFFLASDYVRTHTDLATMEGANEAARRAVNGILQQSPGDHAPCEVWAFEEPAVFAPMKAYDRLRFEMGLPHSCLP